MTLVLFPFHSDAPLFRQVETLMLASISNLGAVGKGQEEELPPSESKSRADSGRDVL